MSRDMGNLHSPSGLMARRASAANNPGPSHVPSRKFSMIERYQHQTSWTSWPANSWNWGNKGKTVRLWLRLIDVARQDFVREVRSYFQWHWTHDQAFLEAFVQGALAYLGLRRLQMSKIWYLEWHQNSISLWMMSKGLCETFRDC